MDGTVYIGEKLLPGALEFLNFLDSRGTPYYFLTNNSSRSSKDYLNKLRRIGLPVKEDGIFTSGEATAIYLKKHYPGAKLFVVGTPSLEQEFRLHGLNLVDEEPDCVVLGFDTTLTYEKIWKLCDFIREGYPYIATHPDINCPTENGFMPDIGAVMALVEASTGRRPDVIIGKPYAPIIEAVVKKTGFPRNALAMIGDRLYTDIAMGALGITTVLVLSGETSKKEIPGSLFRPDYVFENLQEMLEAYQSDFRMI